MAQDFNPLFGFTEFPLGISTIDYDGVALSAIRGLYKLHSPKISILEENAVNSVQAPDGGCNTYRYTVKVEKGMAVIELPKSFQELNSSDIQVWVQSVSGPSSTWVESSLEKITVYATVDGMYNVLVIGTRINKRTK
jgi:hypothetical protein